MKVDPEALADDAIDIAREAGKLLMADLPLGRWRGDVELKDGLELVSRVDRASEALIVARIAERYPDHDVLGEEGARSDGAGPYRWIVDPLDGTINYLHGHPMFAVSIAVQGRAGGIEAAVVHVPHLGEMFFAARGKGAFLNSRSIGLSVSETRALDDALVATGFAYDRQRWPNEDNFVRMLGASRGIRRCGAAAIDLAYVAAGRYDAFWELGLKSWDVAAGALLVQEAGGRIGDFDGGDDWLDGRHVIATNAHLFAEVQRRVRRP